MRPHDTPFVPTVCDMLEVELDANATPDALVDGEVEAVQAPPGPRPPRPPREAVEGAVSDREDCTLDVYRNTLEFRFLHAGALVVEDEVVV